MSDPRRNTRDIYPPDIAANPHEPVACGGLDCARNHGLRLPGIPGN